MKDNYKNDKLVTTYIYHENGQIFSERNYKDDVCISGDCD